MENPYSAPQTPLIAEPAMALSVDAASRFPELDLQTLRNFYRDSQATYAVGHILWVLGVLATFVAIVSVLNASPPNHVEDYIAFGSAVVLFFASYGILLRKTWGRYIGAILSGVVVLICGAMVLSCSWEFMMLSIDSIHHDICAHAVTAIITSIIPLLLGILPVRVLSAFMYGGELFGSTRYLNRLLKEELIDRERAKLKDLEATSPYMK